VRRTLALGLLLAAVESPAATQVPEKVIDVRPMRAPSGNSFEAAWSAYRKAQAAGDAENAAKLFREIRRLRIERNVRSLEPFALALVAEGLDRFEKGDRAGAAESLTGAIGLDPHLPDAYLGLAVTDLKNGPLGILPAIRDTVSALAARLPTSRGRYDALAAAVPILLLGLFASSAIVAFSLLLRHGTLLLHDLEEAFGARAHPIALGVYGVLIFLPTLTFQGWGWLPLWWMTLLFTYFGRVEKAVAIGAVVLGLGVGPVDGLLDARSLAERNPIYQASILAIEGGPDARALADLEQAAASHADDRDLSYLLGLLYRKAGRYDDAATLYRDLLRSEPDDRVALNNLANIEFSRGEFPAAIARYKQGVELQSPPEITATFYYNLEKAHLQKFEYQPAQEARFQADRLAPSLTRAYDGLWKYDKGDYAVVDLSLDREQVLAKFAGKADGIGLKNLAGEPDSRLGIPGMPARPSVDRFGAFLGVFAVVAFGLSRWRGPKMFTMRCHKCGTPFCKHCHLGAAAGGLCTQCHHLFVVRDGVSGPARNQKLLEVQKEDERRERVFRALSLLSPGAGHVYAQKTLAGAAFALVWYVVLAALLLAGRVFPVTGAPGTLVERWGMGVAAVVLLATYVAANRARPDFEVSMPAPRSGRGRVA
jgi:tetratricopeptide (TPR) repeat protein